MSSQQSDRSPAGSPAAKPKPESARTTPEPRDDSLLESIGKAVAAPVIDADKTVPDDGNPPPAAATPAAGH